jgi:hypothetical protein
MANTISYRDILRHRANGMSYREISRACGCARSTAQEVIRKSNQLNITWADVASLSEFAARELINGNKNCTNNFFPIDYDRIAKELSRDRTMTLSVLWEEYLEQATHAHMRPYLYSRFCERYRFWCSKFT